MSAVRVAIAGSSGSIGLQTLDVVRAIGESGRDWMKRQEQGKLKNERYLPRLTWQEKLELERLEKEAKNQTPP